MPNSGRKPLIKDRFHGEKISYFRLLRGRPVGFLGYLKILPFALLLDACQITRHNEASGTQGAGLSRPLCSSPSKVACPEPLAALSLPQLPSETEIESRVRERLNLTRAPAYSATELDPKPLRELIKTKILPQYARAGASRVQIATGAERAFMTAQADYVILADDDPYVRLYNFINLELLKAAKDIATYRKMRFAKSVKDWTKNGLPEGHDLVTHRTYFLFWTHAQAAQFEGPRDSGQSIVNTNYFLIYPPKIRQQKIKEIFGYTSDFAAIPFAGDYVWDDGAFQDLKARATAGQIAIRAVDWTDGSAVDRLRALLQESTLTIAILDLGAIHLETHHSWETYAVDLWKKFAKSHRIVSHLSFSKPRLQTADGRAKHDSRYYILGPEVDAREVMRRVILKDRPQLEGSGDSRLTVLAPDSPLLQKAPCASR